MGTVRTCDSRCHDANGPACACWCGGLFHGATGAAARDAFVAEYKALPTTEIGFQETTGQGSLFGGDVGKWAGALAAARKAMVAIRAAEARERSADFGRYRAQLVQGGGE